MGNAGSWSQRNPCVAGRPEKGKSMYQRYCRCPVSRILLPFCFAVWGCLCLLTYATTQAQLPTVSVDSVSAHAWQLGQTIDLQVNGTRTEWLDELKLYGGGQELQHQAGALRTPPRLLETEPGPIYGFQLPVDPSWPTGLAEMRVAGRFGLANSRPVLLTESPVVRPDPAQRDANTAMNLTPGTIVEAQLRTRQRDHYRILVGEGQVARCVAYAEAIDSTAQLVLQASREGGPTVASSRAIGAWPAEVVLDQPGLYRLQVHDLLYRGGNTFHYLLQMQTTEGQRPEVELDRLLRPNGGNPLANPESLLQLPTTNEAIGTEIPTVPFLVEGSLNEKVAIDFKAQAGQELMIQVDSSTSGCLTDPRIFLEQLPADDTGQPTRLLEQDDFAAFGPMPFRLRFRDPLLRWTVPADGTYRIQLTDQVETLDRPVDATRFRLQVSDRAPGFHVVVGPRFPVLNPAEARPLGSRLMSGGAQAFSITVVREPGFTGAVAVMASQLPPGCRCQPVEIPADRDHGTLVVAAVSGQKPESGPLQFVCRPVSDPAAPVQPAHYVTVNHPATPIHNAPQIRRIAHLGVGANEQETAPIIATFPDTLTLVAGGKVTLPIDLKRQDIAKAECLIRPGDNGPISIGELKIPGDQSMGTMELTTAAATPAGRYSIWLHAETKVSWTPFPERLQREQAYHDQLVKHQEDPAAVSVTAAQLEAAINESKQRLQQWKAEGTAAEVTVWQPLGSIVVEVTPAPQ